VEKVLKEQRRALQKHGLLKTLFSYLKIMNRYAQDSTLIYHEPYSS
jgi:hypothetical protein